MKGNRVREWLREETRSREEKRQLRTDRLGEKASSEKNAGGAGQGSKHFEKRTMNITSGGG